MIKLIQRTLLVMLAFFISSCASNGANTPKFMTSLEDRSLALRTMTLAGNDKYFTDVYAPRFNEENSGKFTSATPVFDILAAGGYMTDTISGIGNSQSLLSNNSAGILQLAISFMENDAASRKRLDYSAYAWIPKQEASSSADAQDILVKKFVNSVAKLDELDPSDIKVVRYTSYGVNGWRLYTQEKMYVEGYGFVEQGHFKNGHPIRATINIDSTVNAVQDPLNASKESYLIKATVGVRSPSKEDQRKKGIVDEITVSGLMPDWYYHFRFVEDVPVVLHKKQVNFFIKPTHKSAQNAPASTL